VFPCAVYAANGGMSAAITPKYTKLEIHAKPRVTFIIYDLRGQTTNIARSLRAKTTTCDLLLKMGLIQGLEVSRMQMEHNIFSSK